MVIFNIIFLALIVGAALKRSQYERGCLHTDTYRFASPYIREARRYVFLSDLHEKEFGHHNEQLLTSIRALRPDAVLIGGDLVVSGKARSKKGKGKRDLVENSVRFLNILKQQYPVYFVSGNHETRLFRKAAEDRELRAHASGSAAAAAQFAEALTGVTVLDGRTVTDGGISLTGVVLTEEWYGKLFFRKKKAVPEEKLAELRSQLKDGAYHIVLLHSPLYAEELCRAGADLVLSGHFHGGTIRLPFLGGLMTPQFQFFSRKCAGLSTAGPGLLLVNRGLGTHTVDIRLNNLPEISLLILEPSGS